MKILNLKDYSIFDDFYNSYEKIRLKLGFLWKNDNAMRNLMQYLPIYIKQNSTNFFNFIYTAINFDSRYLVNRIFSELNNTNKSFLTINANIINKKSLLLIAIRNNNPYIFTLIFPKPNITFNGKFSYLREFFLEIVFDGEIGYINEILKFIPNIHQNDLDNLSIMQIFIIIYIQKIW